MSDRESLAVSAVGHGKINLHLGVSDVRPDGYHELHTVFQSVALQEKVTLFELASEKESTLTVAGHDAHAVPTDHSNLAARAVAEVQALVAEKVGAHVPHVRIHIDKGVPVAGGMAGGSADAAAALIAAVEFYFRRHPATRHLPEPSTRQLHTIAAGLGADVPFCLLGGTALGTGRGDELVSVMSQGPYHWAIATDKRGLSTPKVFAQLDRQREAAANAAADQRQQAPRQQPSQQQPTRPLQPQRPQPRAGSTDELLRALTTGDPEQLAPLLVNDLQAPAISLMPSLRETLAAAKEAEALAAIVSGSGPTIAMLCRDEEHAVDVATAVSVAGKASATMTTTTPAGAARLVDSPQPHG